ncbi:MAG: hypothetical protein U5K51_10020 [Flavobacteriaceae bacterium]|nr:hypothetical protein [Flavobacteriaceae bacterium]
MKNILWLCMFFLSAFSYANNLSIKSIEEKESPYCWAAADAAEKAYCGSVGCSFDYWAGYYDRCTGN